MAKKVKRVRDLPDTISLSHVKVRLPLALYREGQRGGLRTRDVYLYSQWFNGIWVKDDPTSTRMYPITGITDHSEILGWQVVEA